MGISDALVATIRYDTRCYFNVRSKADISQLNLPHGSLIYRTNTNYDPNVKTDLKSNFSKSNTKFNCNNFADQAVTVRQLKFGLR